MVAKLQNYIFSKRKYSCHDQGLNPDHCFVATASESGEQDAREKEMEENMNEVVAIHMDMTSLPLVP